MLNSPKQGWETWARICDFSLILYIPFGSGSNDVLIAMGGASLLLGPFPSLILSHAPFHPKKILCVCLLLLRLFSH